MSEFLDFMICIGIFVLSAVGLLTYCLYKIIKDIRDNMDNEENLML